MIVLLFAALVAITSAQTASLVNVDVINCVGDQTSQPRLMGYRFQVDGAVNPFGILVTKLGLPLAGSFGNRAASCAIISAASFPNTQVAVGIFDTASQTLLASTGSVESCGPGWTAEGGDIYSRPIAPLSLLPGVQYTFLAWHQEPLGASGGAGSVWRNFHQCTGTASASVGLTVGLNSVDGLYDAGINAQGALSFTNVNQRSGDAGSGQFTPVLFFTPNSGASGDPHLRGPRGESFEFVGEGDKFYTIFNSSAFEVNAKFGPVGTELEPYITKYAIKYHGEEMLLTTSRHDAAFMPALQKQMRRAGGKVRYTWGGQVPKNSRYQVEFTLCDDVKIKVTQVWRPNEKRHILYYLNIEFDVPGCHEEYGGVLGQVYQCRYNSQKFEWDQSTASRFQVPQLFSAMPHNASCVEHTHTGPVFQMGGAFGKRKH